MTEFVGVIDGVGVTDVLDVGVTEFVGVIDGVGVNEGVTD